MEPDDLAIAGVQERSLEPVEVIGAISQPPSVALGLRKDVLGTNGELLGFDHPHYPVVQPEGVIGWTVSGVLLLRTVRCFERRSPRLRFHPASGAEPRIDPPLTSEPFGFVPLRHYLATSGTASR